MSLWLKRVIDSIYLQIMSHHCNYLCDIMIPVLENLESLVVCKIQSI